MVFGLPTPGEPNWDVKLDASIEAVKTTADAAAAEIAGRLSESSLTASFVLGVSATQAVMRKLEHDEDVSIVVLSDSTADANTEWTFLLGQALAADYPTHDVNWYPAASGGAGYGTAQLIATGTGSGVLSIYNQSIAGQNSYAWQGANFAAQVVAPNPDLVLVADGHNEGLITGDPSTLGQPAVAFRQRILAVTEAIRQAVAKAQVVLIAQHAWLDGGGDMGIKRDELLVLAQAAGYGFVDMHRVYADDPDRATYFVDNIHLNSAGEQVYADTIHQLFRYDPKWEPRPQQLSLFDQAAPVNLADDLVMPLGASVPVGWTASNATVSRDTANYETGRGYAIRVQRTAGGAQSRIFKQLLTSTTVVPLRGQWVTVAVRMRRPAAGSGNRWVGMMALSDGVNNSRTLGDDFSAGGFTWRFMPHLISDTATGLTLSLFADYLADGTSTDADTTWDRLMLIPGQWPGGHAGRAFNKSMRNEERYEALSLGSLDMGTAPAIYFNAAAGVARDIYFKTADSDRWIIRVSGAETGSNTGSDLFLLARGDGGAAVHTITFGRRFGFIASSASGWIKGGVCTTAARPDPSVAGAGAMVYDTTLSKPIWSDGTTWRDAAGTAV